MKVIDLLNKIANGEEPPKKIKRKEIIFTLEDDIDYVNENKRLLMGDIICTNKDDLNSEIEIIEEPKEKEGFVTNGHRFVQNGNGVSVFPIEEDKEIEDKCKNLFELCEKMLEEDKEIEEIPFNNGMKEYIDVYHELEHYNYKINELIKAVNELKKGK